MLRQIEFELNLPEGEKLNQSMGSLLQGLLMERTDSSWAEEMHTQQVRPYSQYVTVAEGKPVWRIQTITDRAFERLIYPLLSKNHYHLKQRDYDIGLSHFRIIKQETFSDIETRYVLNYEKIHHIHLRFLTSTSCKTQGGYAIFPFPYLILKNLVSKWNAYTDSSLIDSDRTADQLDGEMQVVDYHLHMHPFSLEGRRIRAFRGDVSYGLFQNDMAARLTAVLADFASYAGTGMKTALGMGGTETEVSFYREVK